MGVWPKDVNKVSCHRTLTRKINPLEINNEHEDKSTDQYVWEAQQSLKKFIFLYCNYSECLVLLRHLKLQKQWYQLKQGTTICISNVVEGAKLLQKLLRQQCDHAPKSENFTYRTVSLCYHSTWRQQKMELYLAIFVGTASKKILLTFPSLINFPFQNMSAPHYPIPPILEVERM